MVTETVTTTTSTSPVTTSATQPGKPNTGGDTGWTPPATPTPPPPPPKPPPPPPANRSGDGGKPVDDTKNYSSVNNDGDKQYSSVPVEQQKQQSLKPVADKLYSSVGDGGKQYSSQEQYSPVTGLTRSTANQSTTLNAETGKPVDESKPVESMVTSSKEVASASNLWHNADIRLETLNGGKFIQTGTDIITGEPLGYFEGRKTVETTVRTPASMRGELGGGRYEYSGVRTLPTGQSMESYLKGAGVGNVASRLSDTSAVTFGTTVGGVTGVIGEMSLMGNAPAFGGIASGPQQNMSSIGALPVFGRLEETFVNSMSLKKDIGGKTSIATPVNWEQQGLVWTEAKSKPTLYTAEPGGLRDMAGNLTAFATSPLEAKGIDATGRTKLALDETNPFSVLSVKARSEAARVLPIVEAYEKAGIFTPVAMGLGTNTNLPGPEKAVKYSDTLRNVLAFGGASAASTARAPLVSGEAKGSQAYVDKLNNVLGSTTLSPEDQYRALEAELPNVRAMEARGQLTAGAGDTVYAAMAGIQNDVTASDAQAGEAAHVKYEAKLASDSRSPFLKFLGVQAQTEEAKLGSPEAPRVFADTVIYDTAKFVDTSARITGEALDVGNPFANVYRAGTGVLGVMQGQPSGTMLGQTVQPVVTFGGDVVSHPIESFALATLPLGAALGGAATAASTGGRVAGAALGLLGSAFTVGATAPGLLKVAQGKELTTSDIAPPFELATMIVGAHAVGSAVGKAVELSKPFTIDTPSEIKSAFNTPKGVGKGSFTVTRPEKGVADVVARQVSNEAVAQRTTKGTEITFTETTLPVRVVQPEGSKLAIGQLTDLGETGVKPTVSTVKMLKPWGSKEYKFVSRTDSGTTINDIRSLQNAPKNIPGLTEESAKAGVKVKVESPGGKVETVIAEGTGSKLDVLKTSAINPEAQVSGESTHVFVGKSGTAGEYGFAGEPLAMVEGAKGFTGTMANNPSLSKATAFTSSPIGSGKGVWTGSVPEYAPDYFSQLNARAASNPYKLSMDGTTLTGAATKEIPYVAADNGWLADTNQLARGRTGTAFENMFSAKKPVATGKGGSKIVPLESSTAKSTGTVLHVEPRDLFESFGGKYNVEGEPVPVGPLKATEIGGVMTSKFELMAQGKEVTGGAKVGPNLETMFKSPPPEPKGLFPGAKAGSSMPRRAMEFKTGGKAAELTVGDKVIEYGRRGGEASVKYSPVGDKGAILGAEQTSKAPIAIELNPSKGSAANDEGILAIMRKYQENPKSSGFNKGQGECHSAACELVNKFVDSGVPKENIKVIGVKVPLESGQSSHVLIKVNEKFYDPTNTQYKSLWGKYNLPSGELESGIYSKLPDVYHSPVVQTSETGASLIFNKPVYIKPTNVGPSEPSSPFASIVAKVQSEGSPVSSASSESSLASGLLSLSPKADVLAPTNVGPALVEAACITSNIAFESMRPSRVDRIASASSTKWNLGGTFGVGTKGRVGAGTMQAMPGKIKIPSGGSLAPSYPTKAQPEDKLGVFMTGGSSPATLGGKDASTVKIGVEGGQGIGQKFTNTQMPGLQNGLLNLPSQGIDQLPDTGVNLKVTQATDVMPRMDQQQRQGLGSTYKPPPGLTSFTPVQPPLPPSPGSPTIPQFKLPGPRSLDSSGSPGRAPLFGRGPPRKRDARGLLPDLLSASRSLIVFGKATAVSTASHPSYWKYESPAGGGVPTAEQLAQPKGLKGFGSALFSRLKGFA